MQAPEIIENELIEISVIADDGVKLERNITWCVVHPDELPAAGIGPAGLSQSAAVSSEVSRDGGRSAPGSAATCVTIDFADWSHLLILKIMLNRCVC
jgi:hypothetical protein